VWADNGRKCDSLDSRGFHSLQLQKQESAAWAKQVLNAKLELLVSRSSDITSGDIFVIRISYAIAPNQSGGLLITEDGVPEKRGGANLPAKMNIVTSSLIR